MYKNQLQELAQWSCFNLPAYACIREGPNHAPRFKATVNVNGEIFESPNHCSTLCQAEHAAAEVALSTLSPRRPSRTLAARVLDETSVCKNLLQETAQQAGVSLPVYTTTRSGPRHLPVFTSVVEVAGMDFTGEAAKTKKQAEKNAAMAAWSALKLFANQANNSLVLTESESSEEQEQTTIMRALAKAYGQEEKLVLDPYKQQLPHVGKSHAQRTISSSRPRVIDSVEESSDESLAGVKHYYSGNWLQDLKIEPVQDKTRNYLCNLPEGDIIVAGGPPHSAATYPEQNFTSYAVRYNLLELSINQVTANMAADREDAVQVIPMRRGSTTATTMKERHELVTPTKEHQLDEDERAHGSSVKLSAVEGSAVIHSDWGSSEESLAGVKHYYSGNWLQDLKLEPLQNQTDSYSYNPPHTNSKVAGGSPSHSVATYPGQISTASTVRDNVLGLCRDEVTANRAAAGGDALRVIPTHQRSITSTTVKERHTVAIPVKEHQLDEDEWLHGSSVKSCTAEGDMKGSSHRGHIDPSFNTCNSTWSCHSWWNYHLHSSSSSRGDRISAGASLAPPVRVRSVTAVAAAPPRSTSRKVQPGQAASSVSRGDKDADSEAFSQLRI